MRRVANGILSAPLLLLLGYVLYLNVALLHQPDYPSIQGQALNTDVLAQLRHLKARMHAGAASEMQELFPEGFVFTTALYSLGWSEVAATAPVGSAVHREAVAESRWAVQAIASPQGRAIFDDQLPLPYGAFYCGWLNYSLAKQLAGQVPAERSAADVAQFRRRCSQLAAVLDSAATPYPETYRNLAWPADVAVGVAALAVHDQLFAPRYQPTIRRWVRRAAALTDSTGLLPHEVEARTGRPLEGPRGSSQSLMLVLLADIDPAFGQQQFRGYQRRFLTQRLGLPGIREYPHGDDSGADVDSGPVIWGVGGAASVVGRRAMAQYGEAEVAAALRGSMEAFGMARTAAGQRSYLFGQLPLADAFLAWTNAVAVKPNSQPIGHWRWLFQLYSAAAVAVLGGSLWWLWRR